MTAEAFFHYPRKKALEGDKSAQERLEEIKAFRRGHDPAIGPEEDNTIHVRARSLINLDDALRHLKMTVKLYVGQPHVQIKIESWLSSAR